MQEFSFTCGNFTVVVEAPSEDQLNADPHRDYWVSFGSDASVIVDCRRRQVTERPTAQFTYRILEGGRVVFSGTGGLSTPRTHHGAKSASRLSDTKVYAF